MWHHIIRAAFVVSTGLVLCAQAPEFPKGTYIAHPPADPTSTLAVTYGDDGKLSAKFNDDLIIEGKYTTKGTRIDFLAQTGLMACPTEQNGAYNWKLDGKRLTFTVIEDKCEPRLQSLTTNEWIRQEARDYLIFRSLRTVSPSPIVMRIDDGTSAARNSGSARSSGPTSVTTARK
jgi:hypothetical protein